tara:strand:- start:115 stop:939 length:825 start_codon:yes stop_codon:yes gene_type:complete
MLFLLPQIRDFTATKLINSIALNGKIEIIDPEYNERFFTNTGGQRIPTSYLNDLREEIKETAIRFGFPLKKKSYLDFEFEIAKIFFSSPFLWNDNDGNPTGEALRNNFWAYLTILLLPDIATWRWGFPKDNIPTKAWSVRMRGGGIRNTFQRIFRRVVSFDKGKNFSDSERLELIQQLNEDEFQAIIERTSLSASPKISIFCAEEIISRKPNENISDKMKQFIYRKSSIDLTAYGKVQALDLLSDYELKDLIFNVFKNREEEILRNPDVVEKIN